MLLRLSGKPPPAEDRTATVLQAAAEAFGLDAAALAALARLRAGEWPPTGDDALYERVLDAVARAANRAGEG